MAENSIFLIDIDKVLKDKAGEKAKKIPRFVVSFLKRIVHQDEVNAFLTRTADKSGVDFLEACMEYLDIKLKWKALKTCRLKACVHLFPIIRWEVRTESR